MNKKIVSSLVVAATLLPLLALAFNPGAVPQANPNLLGIIDSIFFIIWVIAIAFFVIMFIVAGIQFASAQGDADKVAQARQFVIYGAVGVVVAVVAFSIPIAIRSLIGL